MFQLLPALYQQLRVLFAPPFCAYCKQFMQHETIFCVKCCQSIMPVVSITVAITQKHSMKVFAVADYKEPLRSLILSKSWSDHVAGYQLGQLIWQYTNVRHVPVDFFIPIPLHWTRYAYRGFNQTEEMARALTHMSGKPMANMLRRNKRTLFQAGLNQQQRHENVNQVFTLAVEPTVYRDKHIILVDDFMTTGSTLRMAAKELLKLKPASSSAGVGCRVV
ncbi:MAG: phosphoribosyltransferase family protein [bacterium]|nr:phosphoribosyltransferase family protein [bacterium]